MHSEFDPDLNQTKYPDPTGSGSKPLITCFYLQTPGCYQILSYQPARPSVSPLSLPPSAIPYKVGKYWLQSRVADPGGVYLDPNSTLVK